MSLKNKSVAGAGWTGAAQAANQAIRLSISILLARLLDPSDFGLIATVNVFTGFLSLFVDMGIGAAIIQRKAISQTLLASAFWFNLAIGIVLTIAFAICAPLMATFFAQASLTRIAQVSSMSFALASAAIVPIAMLRRGLQFKEIAIVELSSCVIGGIVGFASAIAGLGVWSLVFQNLVFLAAKTIAVFAFSSFRPSIEFDWEKVAKILPFSMNLTGAKLVNYWVRKADNVLIARVLGATQLGIYSRAYSLMLLPLGQVSTVVGHVMFPTLSTIQDDLPRTKSIYLKALRIVALITFPISLGLMATADFFVIGLLGNKWADAIPILRILCLVGMTQSLGTMSGVIYQSQNRTDLQLKWTIYTSVIVLSAFFIGINWGIIGVAACYTTFCLAFIEYPSVRVYGSLIGLTFPEYIRNIRGVFLSAATMSVCVYVASRILVRFATPHFAGLLLLVALGVVIYLVVTLQFKVQAATEFRQLLTELWDRRRRKSSTETQPLA